MTDNTSRGQVSPPVMRARLILEVAAGMAAEDDEPYRESEMTLQPADGGAPVRLSASSTLDGIRRVVAGEADAAFINPSAALTVARNGKGAYFNEPHPVCAVTVLPSRDQCLFMVHGSTGFASLEDVVRAKFPLKLGVRARTDHLLNIMLDDILAAAGCSTDDIATWGGEVRKTGHIPEPGTPKFDALVAGELTAVFDEGVHLWAGAAVEAGLTPLRIGEETLVRLEEMGYRRDCVTRSMCPALTDNIPTVDFSGWPLLVREDADDGMVGRLCAGLEGRRDMIPWEGEGPLPLHMMCRDTPETSLGVPLHRAAAAFWTERGYL